MWPRRHPPRRRRRRAHTNDESEGSRKPIRGRKIVITGGGASSRIKIQEAFCGKIRKIVSHRDARASHQISQPWACSPAPSARYRQLTKRVRSSW
jgi:hypothetical protein